MKHLSTLLLLVFSLSFTYAQEFEDLKKEAEKKKEKQNNNFDWLGVGMNNKSNNSDNSKPLSHRFLSFSIYKHIGTNGSNHKNISNNFSFNLFQGHNGALKGLEIGVAGNIQERYARGIQVAGLANVAGAEQSGIQIAGFSNVAGGKQTGLQLSGLANIAGGKQSGIQFSGLVNIAGGAIYGMQVSGFSNISGGKSRGIQVAGLSNVTGGKSSGIYVSGLANVTGGATYGITISGLANVAGGRSSGINIAGLSNVSSSLQGIQIAGLSNVGANMQGIQIAGLANVAAKATGLLIAPINRIDSLNGCLPIGLVTIVKKGKLSQIEFGASDVMHAQVSFRYGARRWYNIYSVGAQFGDANRWGYGLGFGSQWYLNSSEDIFTNIEATTMHINEGEWWTENVNLNNTFRVALGKQFGQWQVFASGNLNTLVSDYNDGETFAPAAPDNTLYSYEPDSGAHVRMWVGATVGVRYVFSKND